MLSRHVVPIGVLLLLLALAGCVGAGDGRTVDSAAPASASPGTVSSRSDSLRLRLEVPREARLGATVPITLRVENVTDRPLELYLRGRTIAFDIIVARADDGAVVWRRLEDEVIQGIVQLHVLAPGETMELRAMWDQRTKRGRRVGAGAYTVRGLLLTDEPTPLETSAVPLRIRD